MNVCMNTVFAGGPATARATTAALQRQPGQTNVCFAVFSVCLIGKKKKRGMLYLPEPARLSDVSPPFANFA